MRLQLRHFLTTALILAAALGCVKRNHPTPQRYSWQKPHATITETGDIEWAPRTFEYEAGESVRYIDYETGDDSNAGTKAAPWKHHPWDTNATADAAQCEGAHTYVFKRGVIYRGVLVADESGEPGNPIRLTTDPSWGTGHAAFYGSIRITNGWKRCDSADAPGIPHWENVWYRDIDTGFVPRCMWETGGDTVRRIDIARLPNWRQSNPDDVHSEWFQWTDVKKVPDPANEDKVSWLRGIDVNHLDKPDPGYYVGATVWTEYVGVMGTPYPTKVAKYDPRERSVFIKPLYYSGGRPPIKYNRYYMENLPQLLDAPGEYYYAAEGPLAGRLYVRLHRERDPNTTTIELARNLSLITIDSHSHIRISGLDFRFQNVWNWFDRWYVNEEVRPACVKILGGCRDIAVANCTFEHVAKAVRAYARDSSVVMNNITVRDNDIAHTDHGAIAIKDGSRWGKSGPDIGRLHRVKVLRNRLYRIGARPVRTESSHALDVRYAELAHIAGNVLDRCYGAGIFVHGGKGGDRRTKPLGRVLIHHNKVTDPLLATNDWGGIEFWQHGPCYLYNNISGNPGGFWHWKHAHSKLEGAARNHATARFGFAYYLDGAFKTHVFNNVAWGKSNDINSALCNTSAFQEIIGFQNAIFNNTAYKFAAGSRRQAAHAGRNHYLGNLFLDLSRYGFRHTRPKGGLRDENAMDAARGGDEGEPYAYSTLAYANNVFWKPPVNMGAFESRGWVCRELDDYATALRQREALADQVGMVVEKNPVRAPHEHDFRPVKNSPVVDRGAKHFVPWGLYAVVGEWQFYEHPADPTRILGENWYPTDEYRNRGMYRFVPRPDLEGVGIDRSSYVRGELEDWIDGALVLNGSNQYCVLRDSLLRSDWSYGPEEKRVVYEGAKRRTVDMDTCDFLIETYLKTEPGHTSGTIVAKTGTAGYLLTVDKRGRAKLDLRWGEGKRCARSSARGINDGAWHHVIAEIERGRRPEIRLYVDGSASMGTMRGNMPAGGVSLANTADFLMGTSPQGAHFAGALDYLRVCRGTLADAETSIDELYAWQFDGPFLRDFFGNAPEGEGRDAGAMEARGRGESR